MAKTLTTAEMRKLTLKELNDLIARANKVLAWMQKQQEKALLKDYKAQAAKLGLDFNEVVGKKAATKKRRAPAKKKRKPARPKYRNPKNPKETWTGKGRAPAWAKPYKDKNQLDKIQIKR